MIWSYSNLDLFTTCPSWYAHKYIYKDIPPETPTPEQARGTEVHTALEDRLTGRGPALTGFKEAACASLDAQARALGIPVQVEQKVGLTRDLKPTGFFSEDAWGRGILDVALVGPSRAFIADWKTGKVREKPLQLQIFSLFGFAHWPAVEQITTVNIWLKTGSIGTPRTFVRDELDTYWLDVLPVIHAVDTAEKEDFFPAQPGPLCGWCPVTSCRSNPKS